MKAILVAWVRFAFMEVLLISMGSYFCWMYFAPKSWWGLWRSCLRVPVSGGRVLGSGEAGDFSTDGCRSLLFSITVC